MRPNIFEIATKELNQDAFIAWLFAFADSTNQTVDSNLNACGKEFIRQLIQKQFPDFNEPITHVVAERQWEGIDVCAEVNDKYLIIIEDKIGSSYHSNQLARYKEIAENWCKEHEYKDPICIYLKTGNESQQSLEAVKRDGYSIFSRIDFINLLQQFQGTNNNIFQDFYERLNRMEKSNKEFENKIVADWNGNDWQGFFQFLEKNMKIIGWSYVNNPNGGFWCAVLNWEEWKEYPFYVQIEEGKLCFKVSTDPEEVDMPEGISRGEVRNELHNLIMRKAKMDGDEYIRRPNRFGNGNYMTVAVVDRQNWLGADDKILDKGFVIKILEGYKSFVKSIAV